MRWVIFLDLTNNKGLGAGAWRTVGGLLVPSVCILHSYSCNRLLYQMVILNVRVFIYTKLMRKSLSGKKSHDKGRDKVFFWQNGRSLKLKWMFDIT